jgi:hypothetical protein
MIVPVDECYRLAGSMRMTWQGISGGDVMRQTVDAFFRRLARRASGKTSAGLQQEVTWQTT